MTLRVRRGYELFGCLSALWAVGCGTDWMAPDVGLGSGGSAPVVAGSGGAASGAPAAGGVAGQPSIEPGAEEPQRRARAAARRAAVEP
jgi:hypothetical protein